MTTTRTKKIALVCAILTLALLSGLGIMQLQANAAEPTYVARDAVLHADWEQEYHAVQFDPYEEWADKYYLHVYDDGGEHVAALTMVDAEGDGVYVAFVPEVYSTYMISDHQVPESSTKKTVMLEKLEKPRNASDGDPVNTYTTFNDHMADASTYEALTKMHSLVWNDANDNKRIDAGESRYTDLTGAFNVAPTGAKLCLAGSQVDTATLKWGKGIALDLCGYTVEAPYNNNTAFILVMDSSMLTIADSIGTGRIDAGASAVASTVEAQDGSYILLQGGHYTPAAAFMFYTDEGSRIDVTPDVSASVKPQDGSYRHTNETVGLFLHFVEDEHGYWVAKLFAIAEAAAIFDANNSGHFEDGEVAYYTLGAAVDAASRAGGGRVILVNDVTLDTGVSFLSNVEGAEFILDLNGRSITASRDFTGYGMISVSGAKLTVETTGSTTGNIIDASAKSDLNLFDVANGELVIDSYAVKLLAHANTDSPIYVNDRSTASLMTCQTGFDPYYLLPPNYTAEKNEAGLFEIHSVANMVAYTDLNENGSFDVGEYRFGDLSHAIAYGGTVVLTNDVTYVNTTASVPYEQQVGYYTRLDLNGHTVTVAEGSVLHLLGNGNVIYDSSALKTGVLDASRSAYTLSDSDGTLSDTSIEGGTFYRGAALFEMAPDEYVTIVSGYFDFDPTDYLSDESEATYDQASGLWEAYMSFEAWADTDGDGVLDDGEVTYEKLTDAIASGASYITLASDVEDLQDRIVLEAGTRTINFNGYTIYTRSSLSVLFELNGYAELTLTTTRGGGIQTPHSLAWANDNAKLIIVDGDYTGRPYEHDNGSVTIQGGTFDDNYYWLLDDGLAYQQVDGQYVVVKDAAALFTPTVTGTYSYNGQAQVPTLVVTDKNGNVLVANVDYTVTATNNVLAGTATATVTYTTEGYGGSETVAFTIDKRAVTVTPVDASVADNGEFTGTTLAANGLVEGHTVSGTFDTIDITQSDRFIITPATVTILDAEGNDVTASYEIEKKSGTLTVEHGAAAENGIYSCCGAYAMPTLAEDGYYELANEGNLFWFASHVNAGHKTANARLVSDIDLNDRTWTVIAPTAFYNTAYGTDLGYAGTFDGCGYEIRNLALMSPLLKRTSVGLFGTVSGTIKNLGINGVRIVTPNIAPDFCVGAIVGQLIKTGLVTDCYVINAVIDLDDYVVGGIAGCVYEGTVQNCLVLSSTITGGANRFGLIAGDTRGIENTGDRPGSLINCYADGTTLYGTQYAGTSEGCATITAEQAASGALAVMLGADVWGQQLGTDAYPVLGGMRVYRTIPCEVGFSNTANTVKEHSYTYDCDTICIDCKQVGRTDTTHSYDDACDASCNSCGEIRTAIHVFDHNCDTQCNLCGYNRIITHVLDGAACTVCGHTITYIEYVWSSADKKLTSTEKTPTTFTVVSDSLTALSAGWYVVNGDVTINARLTVTGEVHLILMDGSRLTVNGGIRLTGEGNSLTVYGEENSSGMLVAAATTDYQAGIGGNQRESGGTLTVHGGALTATGKGDAAGIGGAYGLSSGPLANGGSFTLYGGSVAATGGRYGAGVGGGFYGNGGTVTVYGGTLTATSGSSISSGIGAGYEGSAGTVRIYGGTVYATGYNTGIGTSSWYEGEESLIEIHGGTVVAKSTEAGAGIGLGYRSHGATILITGGHVTATGSDYAAGIGSGGGNEADNYQITITGGTVVATGGSSPRGGGAGIGGGTDSVGTGKIFISGGNVTATGGYITNGTTGYGGAGIGGGANGTGGLIVITGGVINATPGRPDAEAIGNGRAGLGYAYFTTTTGIITGTHTFDKDFTIEPGVTLTIPDNATLAVAEGVTLYNSGAAIVHGLVVNNGTIICAEGSHALVGACDATCRLCGGANENAAAHSYAHACSTICTACGYQRAEAEAAHGYANGICSACGEFQPAVLDEDSTSATYGYYKINSLGQLLWFRDYVNSGNPTVNAVLTVSVDMASMEFTPIGTDLYPYAGIFDGAGYTISGLKLNAAQDNMGFFRYLDGGAVKNLTLKGELTVSANVQYVGGIVGYITSDAALENCHSYVNITLTADAAGSKYIGGVAGYLYDGNSITVNTCTYHGNLQASCVADYVGGVVGYAQQKVVFYNCANYGTVYAPQATYAGGMVSYATGYFGGLVNCLGVGDVTAARYAGRLVGYSSAFNVTYQNNYYLAGQKGHGHTVYSDTINESNFILVTEKQLASGEVAYLLGAAWGQTIGTENRPVLGGATVYRAENTSCQGTGHGTYSYGNSEPVAIQTGLHAYDAYGACTLCDVAYTAITVQGGIALGGTFGIDYYPAADENATEAGVTYNGKDYPAADDFASITGIAAKNLGDSLTVTPYQIIDGVRYVGQDVTVSAAELLMAYVNGEYADTVKAIAIASLNYGASAQVYFGYQTDSLVNASLSDEQKQVTHGTGYETAALTQLEGTPTADLLGVTLLLNDRINFKLLVSSSVEGAQLEIADNAGFAGATRIDFAATEDGANLKAIVAGIAPASWNTSFYFRVVDADGNAISHTLRYSVAAYCQNKAEDAEVGPVASAILALYDAAAAYTA